MESSEGQSLSELGAPLGRLPAPLAVRVALDVVAALGAIHGGAEPGLVHRDLSPRNVMVRPDGVVKLLDLGNAVSGLLSHTTAAGTPGFMSPEQARGAALDQRSDLYALGALLWWMLTGQQSGAPVLSLPPRPPTELEPGLWPLLERLLAPTPEGRPGSAAEVEQELEALATGFGGAAQRSRLAELARSLRPRSARGQVVERLTQLIRGTETAAPLWRVGPWALGLSVALLAGALAWMRPRPATLPPVASLSAAPRAIASGPVLGPPTPSTPPAEAEAEPSPLEPRPSARALGRRGPGFLTIDSDPWIIARPARSRRVGCLPRKTSLSSGTPARASVATSSSGRG
jgi:serine/threonine protein kinase